MDTLGAALLGAVVVGVITLVSTWSLRARQRERAYTAIAQQVAEIQAARAVQEKHHAPPVINITRDQLGGRGMFPDKAPVVEPPNSMHRNPVRWTTDEVRTATVPDSAACMEQRSAPAGNRHSGLSWSDDVQGRCASAVWIPPEEMPAMS